MGKRGPKKQPQSLMDLKGNPEHRPRQADAVKSSGDPQLPLWIDVDAMTVFNNIIAAMPPNFYSASDTHIITMYAEACSLAKQAIIEIQERGITIEEEKYDKEGNLLSVTLKKNPAHSVLSDSMAKIATLGTRLGLDPTARQAIGGFTPGEEGELKNNGFGDLIGVPGGFKPTVVDGGKEK